MNPFCLKFYSYESHTPVWKISLPWTLIYLLFPILMDYIWSTPSCFWFSNSWAWQEGYIYIYIYIINKYTTVFIIIERMLRHIVQMSRWYVGVPPALQGLEVINGVCSISVCLSRFPQFGGGGGSRQHKERTKTMGVLLHSSSNDEGPSRVWTALLEQHGSSSPVFHNLRGVC